MSTEPLLSLKNIKVTFGGVRALKGVSFEVNPGEVHCLAGENGCGKSTLLMLIAGLLQPTTGQVVIGSEIVPAKVATARRNLADAGLSDYAEIREGDARQTLRDLGGPVDFILIDGWPRDHGPSLAREVIEITAPQLRRGGYVMNDNAEPDFLEYVRHPGNGFLSITLPLKGGTELCLKVA